MSNPAPKPAPRTLESDEPVATWTDDDSPGVLRSDVVAELGKLANLRVDAKTISDEEKDRLANVRDAVRDLPAGDYTDEAGRKVLALSRPASFDAVKAEAVIPAAFRPACVKRAPDAAALDKALADGVITREVYDAVTVERIDQAAARDNLPPKVYATCLVPAANPTVRPVDPSRAGGKGKGRGGR